VRIGLVTPVKFALGEWLAQFHQQAYPDTPANAEWCARETKKACVWASARMVDTVETMLAGWRNNANNEPKVGTAAMLPVVFIAMATEYIETSPDQGRSSLAPIEIKFPGDPQDRLFRMRLMSADIRCQIAVVASEQASVMSLIGQLCGWTLERHTVRAVFPFEHLGITTAWPVRIVPAERMSIQTPLGEHIKAMTLDLTIRASMPMFYAPKPGDATDGNTPPGFPTIQQVEHEFTPSLGIPTGVDAAEWRMFMDQIRYPRVELSPIGNQAKTWIRSPSK
jgi:hypothetical protein